MINKYKEFTSANMRNSNSNLDNKYAKDFKPSTIKYEEHLLNADEVANYIIYLCKQSGKLFVNNLQLQKILFFIQKDYYKEYGEVLFINQLYAWDYGPVFKSCYYKYNNQGICALMNYELTPFVLIESDIHSFIMKELEKYINYSSLELSEMSKREKCWIKNYEKGKENIIPVEDLAL